MNSTEQHKRECLAREVARMDDETRAVFLDAWKRRHGEESQRALVEEARMAYRKMRAAK